MSFLISFLLSFLFVRFFSRKFPLDMPNARKIHKMPIPLTGGIAIFVALLATETQVKIILPVSLAFLLGVLDDIEDLSYKIKLPFQVIIAAVAVWIGPEQIYFLGQRLDGILWKVVEVFWFAAMFNALNMIDGMDALASSTSMLSALFLREYRLALALAGFLPFNLPKAKSFLGNSGSAILGILLPFYALTYFKGDLCYATVFLGYPAYEVLSSFTRRILRHRNPFSADKNHTHHLLMRRFGVWRSLLLLVSFSFVCNLLGLSEKLWSFLLFCIVYLVLFTYSLS
ncbi:MAG: MraY family glycosyltransferase, partial [Pseudothermotoga sp.]